MKKKFLLLSLLICFLISGCYKSTTQHRISNDGMITSSYTFLFDFSNDKQTTTEKQMREDMEDYKKDKNNKVTLLNETIDGVSYKGFRVDALKPQDLDSLETNSKDIANYSARNNTIQISLDYSDLSDSIKSANSNQNDKSLKEQGVEFYMIFTVDGTITKTNGKLTNDKKTVVFDMLKLKDEALEIEADLKQETSFTFLFMLLGAVAITGGILTGALLLQKRNKKLS